MKCWRRAFIAVVGCATILTAEPRLVFALDYPVRPVHLVVGFAAGLSPDILA
jgi:hypothetical protein